MTISHPSKARRTVAREQTRRVVVLGLVLVAAFFFFSATGSVARLDVAAPVAATSVDTHATSEVSRPLRSKPIEDVQLGDRVAGTNPLRGEVDKVTPNETTWRKITLQMNKKEGHSLQIELLRPLDWLGQLGAGVGKKIELDLPEMDASGVAEVVALEACPEIKSGAGSIVTGKFVHQVGPSSNVLRVRLEGDSDSVGVTAKHLYWSADRGDFVPVGDLQVGELVNTEFGLKRVASVLPDKNYDGFLYNIETTEHVYRVGLLGTLVHNSSLSNMFRSVAGRQGSAADKTAMLLEGFAKLKGYTFTQQQVPSGSQAYAIFQGKPIGSGPTAGRIPVLAVMQDGTILTGLTKPHPFGGGYQIVDFSALSPP